MRPSPARITLAGDAGLERSLKLSMAPSSRRTMKSVNVPPVSIPIRTIQHGTRRLRAHYNAPMLKIITGLLFAVSCVSGAGAAKIVLIAGSSEAIAQSIVLFANRITPALFNIVTG